MLLSIETKASPNAQHKIEQPTPTPELIQAPPACTGVENTSMAKAF